MGRLSAKGWIIALGMALAAAGLGWWAFVRDAGGRADKVTLRFWNGFTGPDGRTMLRIVRQFNRENPDVHVLMQRMDWHTYYNKLFVAALGGRGPEVFVIHTSNLPRFSRAGFLRPIDDLIGGDPPLDVDDMDANIWQAVEYGGKHLAVPLDVHPQGLYYNADLFRAAGIVDDQGRARPPTNGEEFIDALRKLTRDTNGDGQTDQWGFAFTHFPNNFQSLAPQFGATFFSPDGSRCTLDAPANAQMIQMGVDWIHKDAVAPPPEDMAAWTGFRQGRVAMVFEGVYMVASLQRHKAFAFGGAPIPQFGAKPGTYGDCHTLCMPRGLSGRKLQAAWRLMKFLSDHSLDWAEGGQVPVRKSLRESARFQALPVQSQFARQVPHIGFAPRVPFYMEFRTELGRAIDRALRGRVSPTQALRDAREYIDDVIARDLRNFPSAEDAP